MKKPKDTKSLLHTRNKHRERYDFEKLVTVSPTLNQFVSKNKYGDLSIDFFNAKAVIELNKALLNHHYGIKEWNIPEGFLCPPIPGRADYMHYVADLLANENNGVVPKGNSINCIDIGTGASCIYPLLGNASYDWNFIGTEVNPIAYKSARTIIASNQLEKQIRLTQQTNRRHIFKDMLNKTDRFDLCFCNPPFHSSQQEATKGSIRKNSNLKKKRETDVNLNFGGKADELWCEGGEYSFIQQLILESSQLKNNFLWFTTLVSKSTNLIHFEKWLLSNKVNQFKVIEMKQGNKVSRLLCWTYLTTEQREVWVNARWK